MKKLLMASLPLVLIPLVGCGGMEGDPSGAVGEEPTLAQTTSAFSGCLAGGNVATVTNGINTYCGGVARCSYSETTPTAHNDIILSNSGNYCSCYDWLWSQRNTFPYNSVQIIYHNAATGQCGPNYHIHVQKKSGGACNDGMGGLWHMDIDTSSAESATYCRDDDTWIDRVYNGSCGATDNKQSGVCVNPGGGGWNCANSSYNGVQYWTCNGNNRTKCVNGVPTTETCGWSCYAMPTGRDDLCVNTTSGWNCANSAYGGSQLWTCSGGSLYKCSGSTQLKVTCPLGCNVNPLGTNDTCK